MNEYLENECSCKVCQSMCKTPCIGTPTEMKKIKKAGFEDRLSRSLWLFGLLAGTHIKAIEIVAPLFDAKKSACTFFNNGKCELHDLGLKPMEGRFASCKSNPIEKRQDLFNTPLYKAIAEWEKL